MKLITFKLRFLCNCIAVFGTEAIILRNLPFEMK